MLTGIKTIQQQQDYTELKQNIIFYIEDKINHSMDKCFITNSQLLKYNFNHTSIRYSSKLESDIIQEIEKQFKVVKEYKHCIGQTIKQYNEYIIRRL